MAKCLIVKLDNCIFVLPEVEYQILHIKMGI